jgi:hypothetical protein
MFAELVQHYVANEDKRHIDVMDRLRGLGLSTLDELQRRLEEQPESYTLRELMEQVELTITKPMLAASRSEQFRQNAQIAGPGVSVNVKFITSEADKQQLDHGKLIEHQPPGGASIEYDSARSADTGQALPQPSGLGEASKGGTDAED